MNDSRRNGKRVDRLVRDLSFRDDVRREFRGDPSAVGARYRIPQRVVDLLTRDDTDGLLAAGMDPRLVADPGYRLVDRFRLVASRVAVAVLASVFALFIAAPVGANPNDASSARARAGARVRACVRARGLRIASRRLRRISIRFAKGRRASLRAGRVLRARSRSLRARFIRMNSAKDQISRDSVRENDSITVVDPIE